jgi:hypothetical protein
MCGRFTLRSSVESVAEAFLAANGMTVQHIMPSGELRPRTLTTGAVIEVGRVSYPGQRSLFG